MKRIDRVLKKIKGDLEQKMILEVACGCGELSIAAASFATIVHCIDLEDKRLLPEAKENERIAFQCMDAQRMEFSQETFDTILVYNAIGHLTGIVSGVLDECLRVLKANGIIHVISSFIMDQITIDEELLPYLELHNIPFTMESDPVYRYVKIQKQHQGMNREAEP